MTHSPSIPFSDSSPAARARRPMKPSGVPWIGEIPEGWNTSKIKFVAEFEPKCDFSSLSPDSVITYTPMENIRHGYYVPNTATLGSLAPSLTAYQENDIVMAKVTPCFENGNIAVMQGLSSGVGLGSSELFVFRAKTIQTRYLFYWLQNPAFVEQARATMAGTGGLKRVSPQFVKNCAIHVPPVDEQHRLAAFLDAECARIDSIIEKTRASIEEYKKLKQSVITEAITKGMRKGCPMKESGIEWIGAIPAEWKVCKQKHLITLLNGRAYSDDEFEVDGKYKVLRVGNLFSNPVWYTSSLELDAEKYCEEGDLLYAWSMSYAPVIWRGERVIYHYHIWKTVLSPEIVKEFSYYYYIALPDAIMAEKHQTTMSFLTMAVMNNSYIAYPSRSEQSRIAAFLERFKKLCSRTSVSLLIPTTPRHVFPSARF